MIPRFPFAEWHQPFGLNGVSRDSVFKWIYRVTVGNASEMPGTFSPPSISKKPLLSDPDMHHGTCVTQVPWCMPKSLTRGGGKNVPGIPGACVTHNFTYLARSPLCQLNTRSGKPSQYCTMYCQRAHDDMDILHNMSDLKYRTLVLSIISYLSAESFWNVWPVVLSCSMLFFRFFFSMFSWDFTGVRRIVTVVN